MKKEMNSEMMVSQPNQASQVINSKPQRDNSFNIPKQRGNESINNQIELVTSSSVPPIENHAKMSNKRNESQEVISPVDPVIQNAIAVMPNDVVK